MKTNLDADRGTNGETGQQNLLSRQSDRESGSWILGGGDSEVHPRRDCSAWCGRLETSVDSEREEDANDRVTGRAGDCEASRVKAVVHVPGAC